MDKEQIEKLKIEIVEMYPYERIDAKGVFKANMHVYVIDWDLDIRGFTFHRKGDKYKVFFPNNRNFDRDEQKMVRFPVLNFSRKEKNEIFIKVVVEEAKKYFIKEVFPKKEIIVLKKKQRTVQEIMANSESD